MRVADAAELLMLEHAAFITNKYLELITGYHESLLQVSQLVILGKHWHY